jgi:hypothetical protein
MPFDKGKKRKLIDSCGHERCYSCMFRNEACPLCATDGESHGALSEIVFAMVEVRESRRLRWAGHVARMGERRGAYRALVGKPEGRRPLGRPRRRWEDNIKIDLRAVGWGGRRLDRSGSG